MNDEEFVPTNDFSGDTSSKPSPYELLVRQSKKLGTVATRAFHDINRLLHQEIILPPASEMLHKLHIPLKPKAKVAQSPDIASLKRMVKKSHQILAQARSVFPLMLFPDSIVVDRTKITIIKRDFFWTADVISFQVEDILNVSTHIGPFFGSLTIASRVMSTVDHFNINCLWRTDAIALKHIIQGFVVAKHNNIDTSQLSRREMVETLQELGIDSDK